METERTLSLRDLYWTREPDPAVEIEDGHCEFCFDPDTGEEESAYPGKVVVGTSMCVECAEALHAPDPDLAWNERGEW